MSRKKRGKCCHELVSLFYCGSYTAHREFWEKHSVMNESLGTGVSHLGLNSGCATFQLCDIFCYFSNMSLTITFSQIL